MAPSMHRKVHWDAARRVLRYFCSTSGMGLVLGGRGPVVLIGHADASWLTYLLTNLKEQPRSPPVLYVDNKAMIALCQEHRLEHRTKHITLRYFLARELQQRGQLRLAYVATRANTANIFTKALPPGLASLRVLAFDHEGRPVQFYTWLDDLQLYLLRDSKDSVSLFDIASGTATAPPATADSSTLSQWLTRDAAARLAIRNHLPLAECAHFGQHRTVQALYDAVVARYSSPSTAALGLLLLPYLFPELSAFTTVEDLVSHLRTSDARYRVAVPAEFLDRNPPLMYITLYFIVTRLPESLRSFKDHFLSLDPTSLTIDLLEQHLLVAETSAVAVGAAHGTPHPPFFEGCSPSPLAPSYASAVAADVSFPEDVGAASASAKRRSSKGKGGRGGGGGSGGGGGGSRSGGWGSSGGGGGGSTVSGSGGSGGGGGGSGGSGSGGGGGTGSGGTGARRVGSGGGQRQQRWSETPSPQQLREWFLRGASGGSCPYVIRTGDRASQTCGRLHTQHRCFSRLDDAWRAEFGDDVELPSWADLLKSRIAIFDLEFDAILSAMYALSVSAEGDCYQCVPPDPGIAAAALGASASGTLPGTTPAEALHTFTLDSGASRYRPTPPGDRRSSFLHCPPVSGGSVRFTVGSSPTLVLYELGSSLYTLATEPFQVAASAQVSVSGQVAASCSCRLLSHQTLLWHHCQGHPSLPRLRGMHSCPLVSSLPRCLPPLPPSPASPCLPCVEGRQRAAPHFSSFPPTTAPLHTLHMDVWGPARVSGQSRELYFLLVVDDNTSDGEFSNLLRDFCRGEGILQTSTLPESPRQNGIAKRRIGLVIEVARTSMIHAAAPHILWPFAVQYAAHQLNRWPRVSLLETSSALRWTGEVGDASVFRVRRSLLPPHPSSVFPSQDVTFDESVPFYRLFPYRSAPPPPVDPLPPQGPATSGVSQVDPLPGLAPVQDVDSGAARGATSGGAASEGAEPGGAESEGAETEGAEPGDVETGGAEPGGVATEGGEPEGVEPGGAEPEGVELGGAASEGAEYGGAEPHGAASSGVSAAGDTGDAAGAGVTGGTATIGPGGARNPGTGAAGTGGVEGAGAGDLTESGTTRAGGAGVGGPGVGGGGAGGAGAVDPGGAVRPRPYFVPLPFHVLGTPSSAALTPPLLCPPPDQSQPPLQPASPLHAPSPYTEQSGSLIERREPASHLVSPVRTARRVPRLCPPPVPGTHSMTLRPSSVPLRVLLPAPHESSLPEVPDPTSNRTRAASPTVSRLLATVVTDPLFESAAASTLVAELLEFAAACRLDYATALVAESASASPPSVGGECALGTDVLKDRQEDFECLAAAVPRFASMLLAPEGDPDAEDIPTPRSYAEAITGP
ncbi:unnamed protein product [Closterium sp. NIES-53]